MAKSFIDVVQDSPRTSLDIPSKTKTPLSRTILPLAGPPFGFKLHERLVLVSSRERLFRHPFSPHARSANSGATPVRFLE